MTLPPGLQAVRERAEKVLAGPWAGDALATQLHADVPALLDLIETLAGALEAADTTLNSFFPNQTYHEHTKPGHDAVRAARDKCREFGE